MNILSITLPKSWIRALPDSILSVITALTSAPKTFVHVRLFHRYCWRWNSYTNVMRHGRSKHLQITAIGCRFDSVELTLDILVRLDPLERYFWSVFASLLSPRWSLWWYSSALQVVKLLTMIIIKRQGTLQDSLLYHIFTSQIPDPFPPISISRHSLGFLNYTGPVNNMPSYFITGASRGLGVSKTLVSYAWIWLTLFTACLSSKPFRWCGKHSYWPRP